MLRMASDPSAMPHLNHCYPELRELCDIEAIIEGVRIPLHSQILSRESRLFAQFFSSFHSSGDKGATTAAISQLFDDFDLPTALLAILLVYKPADVEVELVFIKQRWGYGSSTDYGLPDIDAALLQRTFRLLDKLDVRGVLATLVTLPDLYDMIAADRVGWLSASWLIEPGIYMYAVMGIVRSVSDWPSASPTGALTIVTESRWDELPHQAVLLLTECMITRPQFGIPNVLHLLYWRAMGDVVHNIALRLKGASALDDTSDEMLRPPTVVQDVCSFLNRLKIRKMQMSLSEWLRIMKVCAGCYAYERLGNAFLACTRYCHVVPQVHLYHICRTSGGGRFQRICC